MAKHSIQIEDKLYDDIKDYCDFNSLKITDFVSQLLRQALAVEKYGAAPFDNEKGTVATIEPVVINEVTEFDIKLPYIAPKVFIREEGEEPQQEEEIEIKPTKKRKVTRLN